MKWLAFCAVAILAYIIWGWTQSVGEKSDWAALQSIASAQASSAQHLLLGHQAGQTAVGILSTDEKERIWVLLRPRYGKGLKILGYESQPRPKGQYSLSPSEFSSLQLWGLSPATEKELSNHTTPSKGGR